MMSSPKRRALPLEVPKADGIARTDAHTGLRRGRARPIMDRLHRWLVERKDQYAPKSPMASAVRYALNNWDELTRFLDDARIPPDNNRSESALRIVALGRKNFRKRSVSPVGDGRCPAGWF